MTNTDIEMISVVCPLFDADAAIGDLHKRLATTMKSITPKVDFELIYVDDGSRDSTAQLLADIAESDAHVGLIRLSRSFGETAATSAGVQRAEGDAVVILDADLTTPPEVLAEMVTRWREGWDVVVGESGAPIPIKERIVSIVQPRAKQQARLLDRKVVTAIIENRNADFSGSVVAEIGFKRFVLPHDGATGLPGSRYPTPSPLDVISRVPATPGGSAVTLLFVAAVVLGLGEMLTSISPSLVAVTLVVVGVQAAMARMLLVQGQRQASHESGRNNRPDYVVEAQSNVEGASAVDIRPGSRPASAPLALPGSVPQQ